MNEPVFPTLHAKCQNNHEWQMPIPNYWFSTKGGCPECNGDIVSLKAGEQVTLGQLQAGLAQSSVRRPPDKKDDDGNHP